MSLEESDQAAAAVAVAPRVSLADLEAKIASQHFINGSSLLVEGAIEEGEKEALELLTICVLVLRNGFTLIGKSAPASPENFNQELGEKFSREDALRQLWPMEGYLLREKISKGEQ